MTRTMKDSNVEWIGEIPASWKTVKLGLCSYLKGRIGWQGLKASEFTKEGPYLITGTDFDSGKIDWDRCKHISQERYEMDLALQVQPNDLLVTKDGTIGKVAFVDDVPGSASLNSHLLIIRPIQEAYLSRFLYWVLNSDVFVRYYSISSTGTVMESLSQDKVSRFIFPFPSLEEQKKIADCLDRECKKVDQTVSAFEKLISEEQEYKKSLITESVTKGLDPIVEMRDSGIEWIGKTPVNWTLVPAKRVLSVDSELVNPSGYPELIQVGPECIEKDSGKLAVRRTVSESNVISSNNHFHAGQLIYSKVRPTLNKVILVAEEGLCSADMYPITVKENPRFMLYLFLSPVITEPARLVSEIRVKMPKVNQEELGEFVLPIPPRKEQEEIADYLDAEISEIDKCISAQTALIVQLKDYKKSLIYEYVTGKKEVLDA